MIVRLMRVPQGSDRQLSAFNAGRAGAPPVAKLQLVALVANLAASLLFLVVVLNGCRAGFDFTDEAYYLNWISDPWRYSASVSQFGFLYHPLYQLVSGDIVLLRQIGIMLSFALATWLCALVLQERLRRGKVAGSQALCVTGIAAITATTSLSFLSVWLPSPNYNSLNFQAVMLFAIGMGCLQLRSRKTSVGGWATVALGVSLAFLAKPSTAVLLTMLAGAYLVVLEKARLSATLVFAAVAGTALVVAVIAIDGSIAIFAERIVSGAGLIGQLQGDRHFLYMFNWSGFGWNRFQVLTFVLVAPVAWLLVHRISASAGGIQAAASIVFAAIAIAMMMGNDALGQFGECFEPIQFLAVMIGVAMNSRVSERQRLPRTALIWIVGLGMLPLVYAFGTSTNFWPTASRAAIFWSLASILIVAGADRLSFERMLPIASLLLLIAVGAVMSEQERPYRQTQALRLQKNPTHINKNSSVLLSDSASAYIGDLRRLADRHGFKANDFLLDLTGVDPGSQFVLGARPLAAAWTLGGYPGSNRALATALDAEPCHAIVSSWILTEPGSRNGLSSGVLQRFGIDVARDYADVGAVTSVRTFAPEEFTQHLLKPLHDLEKARALCESVRKRPGSQVYR